AGAEASGFTTLRQSLASAGVVLLHSAAVAVHDADVVAPLGVSAIAGPHEEAESAGLVPVHSPSLEIDTAEGGAAHGRAALAGLRIERRSSFRALRALP